MRRYTVEHDQKATSFVVSNGNIAKMGEVAVDYSIENLSENKIAFQIGQNRRAVAAAFQTSATSIDLVIEGFYYRIHQSQYQNLGIALSQATSIRAEIPGRIVKVFVKPKDKVRAGTTLLTQEAMKMEISVKAPFDLEITKLYAHEGAQVAADELLLEFTATNGG